MQVEEIAHGNPGAISVIMQLSRQLNQVELDAVLKLLEIHDITGAKLWMAYKDYARQNIDVMVSAIRDKSPEMAEAIKVAFPEWEWAIR